MILSIALLEVLHLAHRSRNSSSGAEANFCSPFARMAASSALVYRCQQTQGGSTVYCSSLCSC